MMLYCTADQIGIETGGGSVTFQESNALRSMSKRNDQTVIWDRNRLGEGKGEDPWKWDQQASEFLNANPMLWNYLKLGHFYSGTFSSTIRGLKNLNIPTSYTAAAHSIEISKREHEKLGVPYSYEHLTDPALWKRYLQGYLDADVLICPSTHSAEVMKGYGRKGRIEIIPHGCDLPEKTEPLPKSFVLGYLGAIGPDKGIVYLLQAWDKLRYNDGSKLVFAGNQSTSLFMQGLVQRFVRDDWTVELKGWVDKVSDFYNPISCYCQPSASEGFGCEVLEAMSYGRPVLCSSGAGACDLVPLEWRFPACDPDELACKIDTAKSVCQSGVVQKGQNHWLDLWRERASNYTWSKIKARYVKLWKEMLHE